ncbi:hypothetical protein WICPIJ_009936 [Wickerhamomyces pijperi]|uniref:NOT2/NOT3/NOT5 C-terminal domain-containing protein n=1 Tax=Wickerhamomyces pijperi TaxID=599730 RepID=A0A9P8PK35_WICPI|nr:hypothetical protein WICPIJ_009936 [Wickerhamomyces pijperi]
MNRIHQSNLANLGRATPPPPPGVLPQVNNNSIENMSRSQTPQISSNSTNSLLGHLLQSNNNSNGTDLPNGHSPLQPNVTTTNTSTQGPENDIPLTDLDRFGLKGLVPLLRNGTEDKNVFALGTDLSILGLDITSRTNDVKISKTFASPWIETSRSEVEPFFETPQELRIKNLPPIDRKLGLFSDETLFFIFYTKPKDILQHQAAKELTSRNWRYHKDLQVWLTKEPTIEPVQVSPTSERGVYVFFDPATWEKVKKEFVLHYHSIIQSN